jgi:hypothetical protein
MVRAALGPNQKNEKKRKFDLDKPFYMLYNETGFHNVE